MRFLVDAQLPPALAQWLASHGHDAMHVTDLGCNRPPTSPFGIAPGPLEP
jgi:predicted nuclease of predicted toxin-antitoxin system